MSVQILVTESSGLSPRAAEMLRKAGSLTLADLDRPGLIAAVENANVLWIRLRHRIDAEVMAAAPALRIIATPTTGLNHIDLKEANARGVQVLSLRGRTEFLQRVYATAEHTVALMLGALRSLPAAVEHARSGGWNRDLFRGYELHGRTLGIVGYGRVGRMVGRSLRDLGMRVLAWDPHVGKDALDPGVALVTFVELLRQADIVTLHASLSSDNRRFFGAAEFALMRPGAYFINTSRGELVDEDALLAALSEHRIAGAALDVLADEHSGGMGHHPLVQYARDHENLIVTPHIGGCTVESTEKMEDFLAELLLSTLKQKEESARMMRMAVS